ncbi:MAG: phenylalanine--tRNA ligase subunit beta [Sphingomonadaceae bacterium]|uniref:phenylalanine--tRNA ligase subunit beta n=1 Tax=Thermaurantiacus sp. TaxID=2820283 RepID=UPI00298F34B4|nr:phenylalanine--tRNA ligase subunit beta [Thermaurantiacus sp.]MCS6987389.1 phenylalanine--tRNA ligase subunit beta [Sphingomonadaceae bacterium]MDW8415309.1 phenylalanine--tRNA ligase subunit beta [Thermaurantiacus sp.]
MRLPLAWLARELDFDADAHRIAETLTRLGLEVEAIDDPAEALRPFRIARVIEAAPHPGANRLKLLRVDAGLGEPIPVVCGAPNAREGLVGVFAPPGARIPATGQVLGVATIRGVESRGMMCSARELGVGDDHDGIVELPADAPVGAPWARWAGLDTPVLDLAITPNRADCLSVRGIARDLAAAGLGRLRPLVVPELPPGPPCPLPVRIEDPDGCPAFFARALLGARNGPSPAWLQTLLCQAGLRPISALVDVTNYMTIAYGRPLHVYDLATLDGELVARRARAGERLEALDGRSYALDPDVCVIADRRAVHDIGGIMGGRDSGVGERTTDVLIEAAWFSPARIGAAGRRLGIVSEARLRFERGVDPEFVDPGLTLAAHLMRELAGGVVSEAVRAGAPPVARRSIPFAPEAVRRLAGLDVPPARQREILEALGFSLAAGEVRPPSFRRDIEGPADLVAEIVRIEGLERVPAAPLPRAPGVARPVATPTQRIERVVRRALAACGLAEAITWSFVAEAQAQAFGGATCRLLNPLSAELAVMRPSLLPGLVAAAQRNLARAAPGVALFEIGRRYRAEGERLTAALVLAGELSPRDWRRGPARQASAFDAKAATLAALEAWGLSATEVTTVEGGLPEHFHPGRSVRLVRDGVTLAELGELHPTLAQAHDLPATAVAELFLDAWPAPARERPAYAPSPFQPLVRDFAFLVPQGLPAERLVRAVAAADPDLVVEVRLFDRFTGPGVPEGEVSLALSVRLQPRTHTLTEAELDAFRARVEAAAASVGARLRA